MKLTEKQIKEVAENLDCGMRCFYNLKSGELKSVLNFDNWDGADEEQWKDDLNDIENNWIDLFEFEGMTSNDSFKVMADFTKNVNNKRLRAKLINALNRPKPFRKFKLHIENSGDYRQEWFDFKNLCYIEWVKDQIEHYNTIQKNE